jgi:hypothetical protein
MTKIKAMTTHFSAEIAIVVYRSEERKDKNHCIGRRKSETESLIAVKLFGRKLSIQRAQLEHE